MTGQEPKDEQLRANRRKRSIALAIVLGLVVVGFYVLTIVKIGPGIMQRPL